MDSQAPSWRVLDAPSPASAPGTSSSRPATADGVAPPTHGGTTSPLGLPVNPAVLVGLFVAVAGLLVAGAIALGGIGDGIAVDVAGAGPFSSESLEVGGSGGPGKLVVDVAGAVLRPGVYHLPSGSRVGDAIAAAGGYSPRVAAAVVGRSLNLAALVTDGQLIVVPSRDDPTAAPAAGSGGSSASGAGGGSTTGPIDLNTATAEQLDSLPGIGPVTAAKILASRAESPFRTVDELLQRKLVGQKTFDQIKGLVTVG